MVALTAIELPNGHANGHQHSGDCAEGLVLQDDELLTPPPQLQTDRDGLASAAAESEANVSPQGRPATTAAKKVKPSPASLASRTGPKHATAVKKIKQSTNAKSGQSRVRYVPQAELDREQAKLETLSQAALAGDTEALDKLRAALDSCPHSWHRLADLQVRIEEKLITLVAGKDPLRIESFRKRCSELRHELLDGEQCSLAVKMAASRVVATWLFAQLLELRALEAPAELRCIKQLEQAERRFQVAMRTFGMARQAELQLQRLGQHT